MQRARTFFLLASLSLFSMPIPLAGIQKSVAGPAIGQFETKDLESNPGDLQFQSQNAIASGLPRRRVQDENGERRYDDNSVLKERYALELQASVSTWFRARVGIEFEKSRLDVVNSPEFADAFGALELSSAAVEGVFVFVPPKEGRLGIGLLTEFERGLSEKLDLFYAGPIVTYASGPWSASANLLLVQHLRSDDRKRDFAYATQLQYTVSPSWAVALEAYGTIDRLGRSGRKPDDQAGFKDFDQHRIGPVVYYRWGSDMREAEAGRGRKGSRSKTNDLDDKTDDEEKEPISLGIGLLFGLTEATPDHALKLSLEVEF